MPAASSPDTPDTSKPDAIPGDGAAQEAGTPTPAAPTGPLAPQNGPAEDAVPTGAHHPAWPEDAAIDFTVPKATDPRPVPDGAALDHPGLYFNRELSWLDFNWRVLSLAFDKRTPLFERVRFLSITASNLDEFYRKRVGGLKRQLDAGVRRLSPDGRTPREQLDLTREQARPMRAAMARLWEDLRPMLEGEGGVVIRQYASLSERERAAMERYFDEQVFPILTPLAVDPGHPFPFISNQSLSLAVELRHPTRGTEHFARLKVPSRRGRFIPVPEGVREGAGRVHLVAIEEVIRHNVGKLFRGMEVVAAHVFRITRNADVSRNEEEADDLLSMISEEVRERRFAAVVRLEVEAAMPDRTRRLLERELEMRDEDVVQTDGPLDLVGLAELADHAPPELLYPAWEPTVPIRLRHTGESEDDADIFAVIRAGDLLVHHPYESFAASVQRFVEEASEDPAVLAIKMTLYRTNRESPIVRALMRAAENGKQVAVLVELKARFDEENNIQWARRLEDAGAHVTYGLVGLKTHTKTMLVIREEPEDRPGSAEQPRTGKTRLRAYCHIGTGNYNPSTARFYTDLGLLTADPVVGSDLVHLFHVLTGYAPDQRYERLIVAPRLMRRTFVDLIHREVAHAEAGRGGRIVAKMNALDDLGILQELYVASQAGVEIDLIVRGHCRLRPGVPGYSERIRVSSILGRYLEHSRIYHFGNAGEPELFIGSADWQRRNLDDRVEVLVPIRSAELQGRLIRTLRFCLEDNRLAWDLLPDGRYVQRRPADGEPVRALHSTLMERAQQRVEEDVAWTGGNV
jgi:polyphosphate kinase